MFLSLQSCCFYAFLICCGVIEFDEEWGMYLFHRFPSVVTFGIALPFDEVLGLF